MSSTHWSCRNSRRANSSDCTPRAGGQPWFDLRAITRVPTTPARKMACLVLMVTLAIACSPRPEPEPTSFRSPRETYMRVVDTLRKPGSAANSEALGILVRGTVADVGLRYMMFFALDPDSRCPEPREVGASYHALDLLHPDAIQPAVGDVWTESTFIFSNGPTGAPKDYEGWVTWTAESPPPGCGLTLFVFESPFIELSPEPPTLDDRSVIATWHLGG